MEHTSFLKMPSPVGEITIFANDRAVTGISFELAESHRRMVRYLEKYYGAIIENDENPHCQKAKYQLCEYFNKNRREFTFPIEYKGTAFQHSVWTALCEVLYGEMLTYSALAAKSGFPDAQRAAGAACGANPLAIVIPCHRIVSTNNSLTKFGGGLSSKQKLLELEGQTVDENYKVKTAKA